MQIRIDYRTTYVYERPVRSLAQAFRLTPLTTSGQTVRDWTVETSPPLPLKVTTDGFGNLVHLLFTAETIRALEVAAHGTVETRDSYGVVDGVKEVVPFEACLRETALTHCSPALAAFALDIAAGGGEPLAQLHRVLLALHERLVFDTDATLAATTAADAFSLGRGVCQDFTHVFIAVARRLGFPARYVSGQFARGDHVIDQTASHAWAEVLAPGLGWVGFDPTNGISPTDQHVRVAAGLDYLGAAPFRGARVGGGEYRKAGRIHF